MYRNYNKKKSDSSRFFFAAVAVIACVLVITAIIASPSFFVRIKSPDDYTNTAETTAPVKETLPVTDNDSTAENPGTSETASTSTPEPVTETEPPVTSAPPMTTVPETTAQPPETSDALLAESADAGQSYLDKIIFIGDSTTYSFLYYGKLNGGKESLQVWTPASRTLTLDHATTTTILYPDTGKEITIKEAVSLKKPEIIVITLGVNGISYMNEEYFKSAYSKLVKLIAAESPDTKIILQSIFPVAENWEKTKSINNEKITNANKWILDTAKDCGVRYLDTISVLAVGENGFLPQTYQNGDGLHLSPEACDIVLTYIRTHALPDFIQ